MLKERIKKLEKLRVIVEGKTLIEAERVFLKAEEEEIKIRAEELFNSRGML